MFISLTQLPLTTKTTFYKNRFKKYYFDSLKWLAFSIFASFFAFPGSDRSHTAQTHRRLRLGPPEILEFQFGD